MPTSPPTWEETTEVVPTWEDTTEFVAEQQAPTGLPPRGIPFPSVELPPIPESLQAQLNPPSVGPLFIRPGVLRRSPASIPEAFQAVGGQLLHPIKSTEAAIEQFTGAPQFSGPYAPPVKHVSEILELGPKIPKISQRQGQLAQVGAGMVNAASSFVDMFLTPGGATTLGIGKLPEAARRLVLTEFAVGMAANAPEQLRDGVRLAQEGKLQDAAERLTSGTGEMILSGLVASHIPKRPAPAFEDTVALPDGRAVEPRVTPPGEPVTRPPLELTTERAAPGLTAEPEPFPIDLVDLTDRKVYGPGGETGQVTWNGIGIVEVNTGKEVKTWRKSDLDQERLFAENPELKDPARPAVERFTEERAPDIIDAIQEHYGQERVINGREMHAVDPNFPKNGFELNRSGYPKWFKKLFFYPKEGEPKRGHPQDVLNVLQREGRFTNLEDSADAFIIELFSALQVRRSGEKVQSRETKLLDEQMREAEEAERKEKIVEVAFENEERQAIAEAEKLGAKAKVVDQLPEDPNVPFARTAAPSQVLATVLPDGTVVLNRPVLTRFLDAVEPGDRTDAIRAIVHEEVIHSKVTDAEALDYWNALTAAEKGLVRRRYGGPAEGRPDFTDSQLGHEALRARLQQLAGMMPREVFGQTRFERLTVRTILALERVIAGLRRTLGTKASKFQTDMLDRIQRNLDAAKGATVAHGDVPLAFWRGAGELPLEEGKPGETRATAAELGARRTAQLSPAVVAEQFDRHWTQQGRPSFRAFTDDLRKLEPAVQPGQLREAWTDAVWDRLLKAPGSELERLRNVLGLEGKARKELQSRAPIPDPVSPEQAAREARGVDVRREEQPLGFSIEKEVPIRRGEKVLKAGIREYAIARIGEKLIGEAQEGRPALRRTELKPDDIGWWRQDDAKHPAGPAYRSITAEESRNVEQLGRILTQGAAVSRPTKRVDVVRGQPVVSRLKPTSPTVSKRVTAVLNTRTGTVDLLGTFDDHGAMIGDPLRAGRERPNVSLANLLGRKDSAGRPLYRVLDSFLLDEPAQNFRQRFETFKDYRETFRDEVAARSGERESGGPVYGEGVELEGGETPRAMRVPTQPAEAKGAIETGGPITDAEAGAMLDHLYDNVGGKLESRVDVELALEDLADKRNYQVIAGYQKWYDAIRRDNPDLSADAAFDRLLDDVFKDAEAAPNREAFVSGALQRNTPKSTGSVRRVEAPAAEAGLNAPLAFWRNAQKGGKHLAERGLLEPFRIYSEWMVDRLERSGKALSKSFAQTARRIIDREKELYGSLVDVLDPARKEAGKLGQATRWFNAFAEKPTAETAIRNAAPALEGTIPVPAFAQRLRDLADTANRAIGTMLVGVSRLGAAGGKFQRNLTGYGFDLIRRGEGDVWESLIRGNAVANGVPLGKARKFFRDFKAALDDPALDGAKLDSINQDFKRIFPKAITDVKDEFGRWQSVLHSNLFDYLENAARRATHARSFREVFPQTPAGSAQFKRVVEAIRDDTPGHVQKDFDALIKALNGHPTDSYTASGFFTDAFRYMNATLGNLAAKAVLTSQMLTQAPETLVGATPQFLGARRYLRALAQSRQLWTQLEREGKRNAVIYDWSFDPQSPIRSSFKIAGNILQKGFAENLLNEIQEGAAAATAKILADDIRTGALSAWDKLVLPESLQAMGFTRKQAVDMLANRAPHLLEQFERRAASFLTGGNKAIAEGSRLGANRLLNSVFKFQSYPMMKMNQLRKVTAGFTDALRSKDPKRIFAAGTLLTKFLFGTTLQGALTVGVITLFTEGLSGLMVKKEEAEDQPVKFLVESAISTMSGPLYMLFRGGRDGGLKGYTEQAARMFFPYAMLRDLTDMTNGQGQYRDMDTTDRIGKFVRQKLPGTKPIRVALAAAGLAEADLKTEAAIRGFNRWQREQPGYELPGTMLNEDERGQFRTAMKKAVTALRSGDRSGFESALNDAVGEAAKLPSKQTAQQRVAASLRARRILQTPARKYYFADNGDPVDPELLKRLESRIGADAVNRLRYYDAMLDQMAEALNPGAK